jgi:hypothetical protein
VSAKENAERQIRRKRDGAERQSVFLIGGNFYGADSWGEAEAMHQRAEERRRLADPDAKAVR